MERIIGDLDGIAIEIQQPQRSYEPERRKYFNRNGIFAVDVQAVRFEYYKVTCFSTKDARNTQDCPVFQTKIYSRTPETGA